MLLIARVLLPGQLPDGRTLSWTQIAQRTGYSELVDGYTDWSALVELRGEVDTETLPRSAAGKLDEVTAFRLFNVLDSATHTRWLWSPNMRWSDETQSTQSASDAVSVTHSSTELASKWMSEGFSGKAWAGEITIEAPSYADSLLVTAPDTLQQKLSDSGLEVHAVSRSRRIPIWRD